MSKVLNIKEKLIGNIKKYPTNIAAALRLTAKQVKEPVHKLKYMYYGTPSRNIPGIRDTVPMFLIQTDAGLIINTKKSNAVKEGVRSPDDKVAFFDMLFK